MRAFASVVCSLIATIAIGCDEGEPSPQPLATPIVDSCVGVPAAKCDELIASTKGDLGTSSVRSVHVTCVRAPCTVRAGDTTIEVVMTDGRLLSFGSSWHTAGDPEPNPVPSLAFAPSCVGLDANHCTAAVLDVLNTHSDDAAITGILIECTGTCTPKGGKARTTITFADGSEESHEWTYGPSG